MLDYSSLDNFQQITYIFECLQLVIGVIGIIGNILVFVVFSRPSLKKYSYSFYCKVMAIADIGVFIFTFKNWASYVLDADLDLVAPFFCSICTYLVYSFGGLSITMLSLITADRMITIVYSNRFAFLKKPWFQWLIVFAAIVYNVSFNVLPAIYNRIVEINFGSNSSIPSFKICTSSTKITVIQMWILLANFFLFNIIINNLLNVKMIWFIVSSRRKVARISCKISNSTTRDRKFAITSIGLNLACTILKLPLTIAILITSQIVIGFDEFFAIQIIVITISIIDNGASFFINFFLNSIFYNEFLVLLGIRKPIRSVVSSLIISKI